MSRKDQMKNALRALQVNQPYKLKQPSSWKSPDISEKEVPQVEAPQLSQSKSEAPRNEGPLTGGAHNERPLCVEAGGLKAPAHAQNSQGNEAARKEEPHSEPTLNVATQNERPQSGGAQSELPQFEAPEDRVSETAFFKLSHRVFSEPTLQKMSGDCFRLFLWMAAKAWRYPNSEGTIRASISFIEEGTGMSHANISRCLKSLKELNLVRLVHADFKRGNVWWVSPLACPSSGGTGGRGLPKKEAPQVEAAQDSRGAASKSDRSSHKTRAEGPHFVGEFKKLRNQKNLQEAHSVLNDSISEDFAPSNTDFDHAVRVFENEESLSEQENATKDFIRRELSHGYLPPNGVLRRLVAYDWYKKQGGVNYTANAQMLPRMANACA